MKPAFGPVAHGALKIGTRGSALARRQTEVDFMNGAIVEWGRFSDPRAVDYLTATLAARRDKIGRTFFSKVLPLDNFRIENGELHFDDLGMAAAFRGGAK